MAAPLSLAGKTAAITGASGGIGFAIATRFAQEGANVVVAGRTMARLQPVLEHLETIEPWPRLKQLQTHSAICFNVRELQGWNSLVAKHVCLSCCKRKKRERKRKEKNKWGKEKNESI